MRTFLLLLICGIFLAQAVHAAQTCEPDFIPASTPDSQLVDNNDGTVTDRKTGLTWKKCLEGVAGDNCEIGLPSSFTWQEALQQPAAVNAVGFANHNDWRLPNIKELGSLVEEQCANPAINLNRFPSTPSTSLWSGSPDAFNVANAWYVDFTNGNSDRFPRDSLLAVRLVRSGQ
ncbi:MAG: DUF1566 domain-containing protein [Candidatus Electrothrix sp. GW3-4]|uniref:Lcl C-terminal domain-containing protein n=1 Tax=Candidatus Electrothrix sp. GW3-4 TaxID=3126740 RepID=UPI0030CF0BF1